MKSVLSEKPEDLATVLKSTGSQDRIYYKN